MSTNLKVALQDFIHQYFHQNVTFQDTVKVTGTFTVTVDDGKDEDCHLHEVLHKDQHNCSCNLLMGQDRLRHIKQEVESEDEVTENSNCESNAAGQSLVDTKPFSQAGQASLEDSKKLYSDSMPTSTLWLVKNTETGETITAEETAESNLSVMRMGSLLCDESKEIKPSTSDQAEIDENNSIPTSDELSAEKSNENTDVAVECIQMSQLDKDASFRKRCLEKIQKDTNNFMKAGSCKRRKSADVSNMPGEQFLTTEWTQESSPGQSSLAEGQLSERLEEAANETHSISSSSATSQFVSDPQCAEIFKELKQQMFCLRAEVMSRVDKVEERLSNVENSKPLESATNSHTTSSSLGTETVQNVTTTVDEPNLSNSRKGRMASCRKNSKRNEGTAKVAPVSPSDAKQSDRNGTKHSLASEVSATSEREGVRKICPLQQMKFWHRKSSGFANFGVKAARYLFSPDEISKANCSAVQGKQDGMDLQCLVLDEAAEIKLETEPVMTKNLTSLLEELEASGKVSCDECGYVCSKECELERHKQIHTLDLRIGERRDSCNQFFYQQTENSSQTSSGNQLHYDKPTASACEQEIRSVNSCQESAVSERYRVNTRQKFQRQLINQNLHGTPRNRSFQRHAESIQRDLANNTGCELIRDKANQDVLQDGSKSNLQHISTKNPTQNFHDTSRTESFSELFRHSNLTNSTEGQHFASVNGGSGFNREISNAANRIPNFPEQAGGQSFDRVGNWNYQENLSRTQVSADIYTDSVHGDSNMQNLTENQNFEQGSQQNTTFPPDKTNGFLGQMANWFSGNENYDSGTGNHCFQTESNNTACSRGVTMAAESVSESQSFHCSRCRKCFKSRRGLGKHMSHMHHRSYLYKCDVCRKSFTNKSEFLPHLKYHPCKSKQFMCGDCGKSYLYKKGLDKHFDSCQQKKKISACNFCGKVFTSECQLSDHIKGKHQFPRYQCVCGRRFKWRSSLAYHRQHCLEARS